MPNPDNGTMNAKLLLCLALGLSTGLFDGSGFAQSENSFFQFVQGQSKRHYSSVPHQVLALYYGWYGMTGNRNSWGEANTNRHELSKTARYPVKGPYSSHDPAIINWQIDQAKAHGITGFVVSWWGKGKWESWHDQSLALLLKCAEKKDFKVSVYWEQERDTGAHLVQFAVDDLSYVLQRYGKSKAFLKVDGKPVIFVYDRVESQTPLASMAEIIQKTRAKAGDFLLIGQGYQGSLAYLFDGLHTEYEHGKMKLYLLADSASDKLNEFREWASESFTRGAQIARQHGRIVCPMIIPGFNNIKSSPAHVMAHRYDGQTYRAMWEAALKTKPDWILISSWNEWLEGTEVEPSLELGEKYLQITAKYAKPFLKSARVPVPPPTVNLPRLFPGTTNQLDKLLAGRTVGILSADSSYNAEFWADYFGATVRRLTWADLINPNLFNAGKFPILISVAGEHYHSSIKSTDDVTDALIRYLHQGGFLVSLPTGPWPFYYDDSRKGIPYAITDKLALGVDNGFDQPPAGAGLKFYVNKSALLGLPHTAPFPSFGDLRFRPASRRRVPSGDYYLPLVQLWDNRMHFYGDAAVYIQHETYPLAPGKCIYVWMRTAEALGPDRFYPSLFQFISTKLGRPK